MFNQCLNNSKQGDVGLTGAMFWFSKNGYNISLPITDTQAYDLLVEKNGVIHRVQVKTTKFKDKSSNFSVVLKTSGRRASGNVWKLFDNTASDILFIVTAEGVFYNIPSPMIKSKCAINLCRKYEQFIVT